MDTITATIKHLFTLNFGGGAIATTIRVLTLGLGTGAIATILYAITCMLLGIWGDVSIPARFTAAIFVGGGSLLAAAVREIR